jgi:hypothetical protein
MTTTAQERLQKAREAMAARSAKKTEGSSGANNHFFDKFYPFTKGEVGSEIHVRFLPDANPENPLFYKEKYYHEITVNGKKKRLPCLYMSKKETCPCCKVSQGFYDQAKAAKNAGDTDMEKALSQRGWEFYKRVEYVANILVVNDGGVDPNEGITEDSPEYGKSVRILNFRKQLFNVINSQMADPEILTDECQSYEGGHNFKIKKTKSGKDNAYTTSSFSPRPTALSEDVIEKVKGELFDLETVGNPPEMTAEAMQKLLDQALGVSSGDDGDSKDQPAPKRENVQESNDSKPSSGASEQGSNLNASAQRAQALLAKFKQSQG